MKTYRKLPVTVEAIQWTGDNEQEIRDWTDGGFETTAPGDYDNPEITAIVWDALHDTWVGVKTGQSVLRGVKGEFYPIDAEVLAETYELVSGD
jgi:hypothetical protein